MLDYNQNKRIEYIDALRGFTMILVVFSHIELFSFNLSSSFVGDVFRNFRMPLFFFISGLITGRKEIVIGNVRELFDKISKKVKVQLIPTIVFGIIYTYFYCNLEFNVFVESKSKLGFWFTICLLWMFIILYLVSFITSKLSKKDKTIILIAISCFLYILKTPFIHYHILNKFADIFCLHQLFIYFQFFSIGYIFAMYKDIFNKVLDNSYISIVAIISFICMSYVQFNFDDANWNFGIMRIYRLMQLPLLGYMGIYIVFNCFRIYRDSFLKTRRLGAGLQYIGKRTLDIYLLHYFFIPSLPQFKNILSISSNIAIELFVCLLLAILIIGLCLVTSNILRISPILAKYILGAK